MTARCGCEAAEKEDDEEEGEGALDASFKGDGCAVYPGFSVCDKTVVSFEVRTIEDDNLDYDGDDDLDDDVGDNDLNNDDDLDDDDVSF